MFYDWKIWQMLILMIALGALIGVMILGISDMITRQYEYVDLDGNTGIAESCSSSYGDLTCRTADYETMKVKSYKRIEEER